MNKLDELFSAAKDPVSYARAYGAHLSALLGRLDYERVGAFIELLLDAREKGQRIFFIGNGGSAATASHFANDIGIGTRSWDKPFRVMSLTDNAAVMTAIANDDGYENLFVQQLANHIQPGDVVVSISASGNSPNILKAMEYAASRGATNVALAGFDGGRSSKLADLAIVIETTKGEYGPVEDLHMFLDHLVGTYLMRVVRSEGS